MSLGEIVPKLRVRYLSVYLLLAALGFGLEWMLLHPHTPLKALWLGLLMCLSLLIAPCLWFCTLEVTENVTPGIGALPLRHRMLILLALLCTLPLLFSAHMGTSFENTQRETSTSRAAFIHGTMLVCVAVFCFQVPLFIRKSLTALRRHEAQVRHLFANLEDCSLNALRLLLIVVGTKWLMNILRTLHCMVVGPSGGLELNLFMSLEITATLWALFVVFRHNRVTTLEDQKFVAALRPTLEEVLKPGEKYANSALDAPARRRILNKLDRLMTEDAAYQNSDLSLKFLSEQTRESPHYLSQVINQEFGGNFYEWVNRHRIDAAQRALLKQPELSILDISAKVGFNSKSTFNAAFRRLVGMTPTEFRRQPPQEGTDRSSRTP